MTKYCKYCGKPFETNSKVAKFCKREHYNTCKYCGKSFVIKDVHYPDQCCSVECRNLYSKQKREETSLKRYGVKNAGFTEESQEKIKECNLNKYGTEWATQSEEFKEKAKQTCLEKYGTENAMQNAQIRQKAERTNLLKYGDKSALGKNSSLRSEIAQTNLEKYGTVDPGNLPQFREKARQTSLNRYGVEYYVKTDEYRQRVKQTSQQKYGVDHFTQSPEVKAKMRQTMLDRYGVTSSVLIPEVREKLIAHYEEKYGVPWPCMRPECLEAQGNQPSRLNRTFGSLLESLGFNVSYEYRIENKSYDIKVENTQLLIEIDPTYTHTTFETKLGNKDKHYHKNKSKLAEDYGFHCIHIFDWDDQEKIVNMLLPKESFYARKCTVSEVNEKETNEFLSLTHLQGSCKGQKIRLGLYYEGQLMQLMTFGQPRYNKNFEYELLRLCTVPGKSIVGGSAKLFKYFIDNYRPESIISYCDRSKFTGNVYLQLGFKLSDEGEPSIHWSKYNDQITDNLLRQKGYDQLFGTSYGKGTSNEQLMLENGWLPVADCGQSRYEWRSQ